MLGSSGLRSVVISLPFPPIYKQVHPIISNNSANLPLSVAQISLHIASFTAVSTRGGKVDSSKQKAKAAQLVVGWQRSSPKRESLRAMSSPETPALHIYR